MTIDYISFFDHMNYPCWEHGIVLQHCDICSPCELPEEESQPQDAEPHEKLSDTIGGNTDEAVKAQIIMHLQKKKEIWESRGFDNLAGHTAEAIRCLEAGNPAKVLEILIGDDNQWYQAATSPSIEDNKEWKDICEFEVQRHKLWIDALEEATDS